MDALWRHTDLAHKTICLTVFYGQKYNRDFNLAILPYIKAGNANCSKLQ